MNWITWKSEYRINLLNLYVNKIDIITDVPWEHSGSVVECFNRDRGAAKFEPHRHHCIVSLSKNIYPSLVLDQSRKTHPFITERLLMSHKESNQKSVVLCLNS